MSGDIHVSLTNLPSTLAEWSDHRISPIHGVWEPLRAWFASEGLYVFDQKKGETTVTPPVNELRAPDVTYSTQYDSPNIALEHRVCVYVSCSLLY
jgi:hypothetical protein